MLPLLAMVKADAYGLGAVPVARALEAVEPWGYGLATHEEAVRLRSAGIDRPLLVFSPSASLKSISSVPAGCGRSSGVWRRCRRLAGPARAGLISRRDRYRDEPRRVSLARRGR